MKAAQVLAWTLAAAFALGAATGMAGEKPGPPAKAAATKDDAPDEKAFTDGVRTIVAHLDPAAAKQIQALTGVHPLDAPDPETGMPRLHFAARHGFRDAAELLLQKGAGVDARNAARETALHAAAVHGHAPVAELLLKHKADVNAKEKRDVTPLHYAANYGHHQVAELLLKRGAKVNAPNNAGDTPLHAAARQGHVEAAKVLLAHGADPSLKRKSGATPLKLAMALNKQAMVQLLQGTAAAKAPVQQPAAHEQSAEEKAFIEQTLKPAVANKQNLNAPKYDKKRTFAHVAAEKNYPTALEFLIAHKADINRAGAEGHTPLHRAAMFGANDAAEVLLKHQANVDARTGQQSTPLHLAALNERPRIAERLVAAGAAVDAKTKNAMTPLHYAAEENSAKVTEVLLKHGASISARDDDGWTPLHMAAHHVATDVAKLLLKHHADVKAVDKEGWSSLHTAIDNDEVDENEHARLVRLLLEHGADVNAKTAKGGTPLHVAAEAGYQEITKLLVHRGADRWAEDADGDTPLAIAAKSKKLDLVKLLQLPDIPKPAADTQQAVAPKPFKHEFEYKLTKGEKENVNLLKGILAEQGPAALKKFMTKGGLKTFHKAVLGDCKTVVQLLLDNQVDVNLADEDGITPLHCAASSGATHVAELLLQRGADPSLKDKNGVRPMDLAKASGKKSMVALLEHYAAGAVGSAGAAKKAEAALAGTEAQLEHLQAAKAFVEEMNKFVVEDKKSVNAPAYAGGWTLLHKAASKDFCLPAKTLITDAKAKVDVRDDQGRTPLHIAAAEGHEKIAELLLKYGADPWAKAKDGTTPGSLAAASNNEPLKKLLADYGALPADVEKDWLKHVKTRIAEHEGNFGAKLDAEGSTALHLAAARGYVYSAKLLLQMGATIDALDSNGRTPLHRAALAGHEPIVSFLLGQDADPTIKDKQGKTAKHLAWQGDHDDLVALLGEKEKAVEGGPVMGAWLFKKGSKKGKAGKLDDHVAAEIAHSNQVVDYINKGLAKLPGTGTPGSTPPVPPGPHVGPAAPITPAKGVEPGVGAGQTLATVKAYLDGGGDPNAKDLAGNTPLHWAAKQNDTQVAALLIEGGARIDAVDFGTMTPLYHAAMAGHRDMVELLLQSGANRRLGDRLGYSPARIAAQQGHPAIAALIQNWKPTTKKPTPPTPKKEDDEDDW